MVKLYYSYGIKIIMLTNAIPQIIILVIACVGFYLFYLHLKQALAEQLYRFKQDIYEHLNDKHGDQQNQQLQYQMALQDTLRATMTHHTNELNQRVEGLTKAAETKLQQINTAVEQRLNEGFAKTNDTFADIAKRLILIDDAQRKLTDLSNNVLSLQAILADKKSRGAFGEVQLKNLIENLIPSTNYALQHQLSNGLRCDCMLFLPEPTGNIAIDAKFPLENFQRYNSAEINELERKKFTQVFSQDIKKHINDIAIKYIIPGETAQGALMFIPAESIFAELHNRFPELIALAQQQHVWIASPTTMMAILTTASAVLKDNATRQHVDYIQKHLRALAKDFSLFEERMQKLSRHIEQAHTDTVQINTSASKISKRFAQIDQVDTTVQIEEWGDEQ